MRRGATPSAVSTNGQNVLVSGLLMVLLVVAVWLLLASGGPRSRNGGAPEAGGDKGEGEESQLPILDLADLANRVTRYGYWPALNQALRQAWQCVKRAGRPPDG